MRKKDRNFVLILVIFVIAATVSWNLYFSEYIQRDTVSIHSFPKTIDSWTSRELPISEDEYEILETKNAFVREYSTPEGEKVYLINRTVYPI